MAHDDDAYSASLLASRAQINEIREMESVPPFAASRPLHVLIVEDSADHREILAAQLKSLGCRVDAVEDGSAGIRLVRNQRPDVVVLDLGMPRIDGWSLIREVRALPIKEYRPYIIVLSGFNDADSRRTAFENGCDEYIVKPFSVAGALRSFIARRHHRAPLAD